MVAMQRRGTNVVVGGDRQKLGAKELDVPAVVKRNRKQITAILVSLTVFAVLLSKSPQCMIYSIPRLVIICNSAAQRQLRRSFKQQNVSLECDALDALSTA